jgi:putative SOS response-associated peptidase YedK
MRPIHDRMPVIVAPDDYAAWLDPAQDGGGPLLKLLRPYAGDDFEAYTLSTRVNSPRKNGVELIERIDSQPRERSLFD